MVSLETPVCAFGEKANDFSLLGTNGEMWSLNSAMGERGLLVMFICNHCPYVKSIRDRIVRDTNELKTQHGINTIAIMANDPAINDEDSFENMKKIADEYGFSFPYVIDETQAVAKSYGAVCTPDFFGYNKQFELQYRGRLDVSKKQAAEATVRRDLFEAMKLIAATGQGPADQIPSMGCSIKWKMSE